jgi:hypothetical protein
MKGLATVSLGIPRWSLKRSPERKIEYITRSKKNFSYPIDRRIKKCYNTEKLNEHILVCDNDFWKKLLFKAKFITNINDERIDRSKMVCFCDTCHKRMRKVSEWKMVNQSFRAMFYCKNCNDHMMFTIKFKEYYDHIDIKSKKSKVEENKTKEKGENKENG